MRRTLTIACAAAVAAALTLPSGSLLAQDELAESLASIEKSLWHGWAMHDTSPFEEHVVENAVQAGGWGLVLGKKAIVEMIGSHDCELEDAKFADWTAHEVSDGTAILTYTAMQKGSCDGEALPEKIAVTATYVRHGDHWMSASYQESTLEQ
jgi:hypothetical protein